jgi:dTDP-4-amino-4,6-dideoxygalactose transaminase
LATHVFGNPCAIEEIDLIAKKHNLKVIYDAAHCFGSEYLGKSVFSYGDISTTSFHSTKLFHTVEGGAVFTNSPELLKKMVFLRNFGHNGPDDFESVGINGKNSEFHAAMGLSNFPYINKILESRKLQSEQYDFVLKNLFVKKIKIEKSTNFNFAYYPIVFENEKQLLNSIRELNSNRVFPRRYFYPSLNKLKFIEFQECKISEKVSKTILCLPLYYGLTTEEIDYIGRILLRVQNN